MAACHERLSPTPHCSQFFRGYSKPHCFPFFQGYSIFPIREPCFILSTFSTFSGFLLACLWTWNLQFWLIRIAQVIARGPGDSGIACSPSPTFSASPHLFLSMWRCLRIEAFSPFLCNCSDCSFDNSSRYKNRNHRPKWCNRPASDYWPSAWLLFIPLSQNLGSQTRNMSFGH